MKSLATSLLVIAPLISANIISYILPFKKIFNSNQELCLKLNESLYQTIQGKRSYNPDNQRKFSSSLIKGSYELPGNFFDLEDTQSHDFVTKRFTFKYAGTSRKRSFNITTKLPSNVNLEELMHDGTVRKLFPVYYVVSEYILKNSGNNISFYFIEGERCKAKFDKNTQKYLDKRCWKQPSLCRGSKAECLINDDENVSCYDAHTGEGKREEHPGEIHYSMMIGERIHWQTHFSYNLDGLWTDLDSQLYIWNCTDLGENVNCDYIDYRMGNLEDLNDEKLFTAGQELCKVINKTLFGEQKRSENVDTDYTTKSILDTNYVLPGNFFDVEGDESEDSVSKTFVFNINKPILNITTKLPRKADLNELMIDKTVRNLFPINYRITEFTDGDSSNTYYLIEGERCKAVYDKSTNKLTDKRCWNTPSFCKGYKGSCLFNDDENALCYDADSAEGKRQDKPGEVHYSVEIGTRIYWRKDLYLSKWNCTDMQEYIFCNYIVDGEYPHIILKTISGHHG